MEVTTQLRESQQSVAGCRFPVGILIVFMVLIVAALYKEYILVGSLAWVFAAETQLGMCTV